MIVVRKLLWDTWNVHHIARHHITQEEVEAVCHNNLRGQQKNRLVLLGQTDEYRILAVVLESNGKGVYYPVTAYNVDKKDSFLYKRLRGGEKIDEKD